MGISTFSFQRRSPDEYANVNLYFRVPSDSNKYKKFKKVRFPVNRFDRIRARMSRSITFESSNLIRSLSSKILSSYEFLSMVAVFCPSSQQTNGHCFTDRWM